MDCDDKTENSTKTDKIRAEEKLDVLEFPTVATSIFKYLPAKELSSCAKVCRSWNSVSTNVKENRRCIYIITKRLCYQGSFESILQDQLAELCSEPNLALFIGVTEVQRDMESCFFAMNTADMEEKYFKLLANLKRRYTELIRTANREFEKLRKFLPTKCRMLQLAPSLWSYSDNTHFPRYGVILIPKFPGVTINAFIVPIRSYVTLDLHAQAECLSLSEKSNSLSDEIKCLLLFGDLRDISNMFQNGTDNTPPLEDFIRQDAIIIGGKHDFPLLSTGIAFSGESVRVLGAAFQVRKCCAREGYLNLRKVCSNDDSGIAFVLSIDDNFEEYDMLLLSEHFPKIPAVVIHVSSVRIFTLKTVEPVQWCEKCFAMRNYEFVGYIIIFILFKDSTCKVIHLREN